MDDPRLSRDITVLNQLGRGAKNLAPAALAGLYVASPVDVIPDFIPGLGQVDDIAVVAAVAAYYLLKD